MATYYLDITRSMTTGDLRRKFAAFEELYGKSKIVLRGQWQELFKANRLLPVFGTDIEVTRLSRRYVYGTVRAYAGGVISDAPVKLIMPKDDPVRNICRTEQPQAMFISLNLLTEKNGD